MFITISTAARAHKEQKTPTLNKAFIPNFLNQLYN